VFRVTDYFMPTLLLDEADTFLTDSEGLRGILNSGHMRSQAYEKAGQVCNSAIGLSG
jgi:putative DNA primase/helicase